MTQPVLQVDYGTPLILPSVGSWGYEMLWLWFLKPQCFGVWGAWGAGGNVGDALTAGRLGHVGG